MEFVVMGALAPRKVGHRGSVMGSLLAIAVPAELLDGFLHRCLKLRALHVVAVNLRLVEMSKPRRGDSSEVLDCQVRVSRHNLPNRLTDEGSDDGHRRDTRRACRGEAVDRRMSGHGARR